MGDIELRCRVPGCEKFFDNHFQLYRHNRDVHHPRFCLYCPHVESRGFVLRKHIEKEHPTVKLPEKSRKVKLYRNEGDPQLLIPPAPEKPVSVPDVFPSPEGYQPYTEDVIAAAASFTYTPTPIAQRPSSNLVPTSGSHLETSMSPALPQLQTKPRQSTSTTDKSAPSTSSKASGKKPSISSSDLDYEDESGIEYELLEECAYEPSQEGNISSVETHEHEKSASTKEQDTRKVISVDKYRSRKVEEKQIQDMQEAIANLICTAGYKSLLKEV